MNFTILPTKKKQIKTINQASKELNYKVFLVDEEVAVLIAAFAFKYNADDFVDYMATISKAAYTIVYEPSVPTEEPIDKSVSVLNLLGSLVGNKQAEAKSEDGRQA